MPVELVSFTADVDGYLVNLSWITATEINNFGFEIERKTNDNWEKIGFVNGNGTTTEMQYYSFTDNIRLTNNIDKIYYRLKQIDFDGTYEYSNEVEIEILHSDSYLLKQNYPNPLNPNTNISFSLPEKNDVKLVVYDINGNLVEILVNKQMDAGDHSVKLNSDRLASGIYYYKFRSSSFVETKKMILLK